MTPPLQKPPPAELSADLRPSTTPPVVPEVLQRQLEDAGPRRVLRLVFDPALHLGEVEQGAGGQARLPAPRSASSASVSTSRTAGGRRSNRSATARAMTDQRGGFRFDGLVVGQSVHFLTMRSPASGRSFAAALNAAGCVR